MKKKFTKKEKITLAVLAGLMVVVIAVGAVLIIGNTNKANEEAKKLTQPTTSDTTTASETQQVTNKAKNDKKSSAASEKSDKNSSSKTSGKAEAQTEAPASSQNGGSSSSVNSQSSQASAPQSNAGSSSASSSKTSSKKTVSGDKITEVKPEPVKEHKSSDILKVNGKECHVGDVITVVLNVKSDKSIVNYQGFTVFDSAYLKVKEVMPNAVGIASDSDDRIDYNASSIAGMNFSEKGTIYSATFEVLKTGETKIKNTLEIISQLDENHYLRQLDDSDYKTSIEIYD